jgi:hypothetical protein
MKKIRPLSILLVAAATFFSGSLLAQEETEVSIKVKKDGKVVKDTTYKYSDDDKAKHAVKMMEVMTGDKELMHEAHPHGEHVIVMKSGDGNTFDILIDEEVKGVKGKEKKYVKVMVSDDEHGTWHVEGDELKHIDEDVYVISGDDDVKVELKEILEEHGDGENVKVVVVKKKIHKDCDHEHKGEDVDVDVEVKVEKKAKKKSKKQ